MRSVIARLSLGFSLIALTAVLLLASDWHQRRPAAQRVPQVAIVLLSSQPVLVEGLEGALETLRENGFIDGQNIALRQYNAEGDMATLNAIARQVTDGQFDMVMTFSTPAMQAVAKANTKGKAIHVFGLVADPFAAGVGLRREAPLDHPRHLVGTGIPLPVDQSFQLARKMFPRLKTVGVAWNPAESNSVGFVGQARKAAQELQIELLEAHVDNSSGVLEAASSLASRGAEALWVPGDNTILSALNSVLSAAKKARIPAFGISPGDPERGTILDLGANFHEIGKLTGNWPRDENRAALGIAGTRKPEWRFFRGAQDRVKGGTCGCLSQAPTTPRRSESELAASRTPDELSTWAPKTRFVIPAQACAPRRTNPTGIRLWDSRPRPRFLRRGNILRASKRWAWPGIPQSRIP